MADDQNNGGGLDPTQHCTVEMYAAAKRLPVAYLKSRGLFDVAHPGTSRRNALGIEYRDATGKLLRKRFRTYTVMPPGKKKDRFLWDKSTEVGAPPYGADTLPATIPVLAVPEGESNQQTLHFHGYAALGFPGATTFNTERDDPTLARAEKIVLFVDPDSGGNAFLTQLSKSSYASRMFVARLVGAKDVSELHIKNFDAPENFKAVIDDEISRAVLLSEALTALKGPDSSGKALAPLPTGFRYMKGNIEFRTKREANNDSKDKDKVSVKDMAEDWRPIMSRVEFLSTTRDRHQRGWGLHLRAITPDYHQHNVAISREMIVDNMDDVRRMLADMGVWLAAGRVARSAQELLFNLVRPKPRALSAAHVGWHERTFVLPDATFGPADEMVVYQPPAHSRHAFQVRGTLSDWKVSIASRAVGNSRILLSISTAFAAPLLQLMKQEGGGVHLRGPSSIGKSTALDVAGSVCGGGGLSGFRGSWRATDNGLELLALLHCDCLLALDELAEIDAAAAQKAAYMLANGSAKTRGSRSGDIRPKLEWRTLILSTGEISMSEKLAENRMRATAGQEVRFLDIPADAGVGLGLFENLHGADDPSAFAESLKVAAAENYGHAFRQFLGVLCRDLNAAKSWISMQVEEWMARHCPARSGGQIRRAGLRFALIGVAGELARRWEIVPWPEGESSKAAARCFMDWLDARGGLEPAEVRHGVANVRDYLQRHGATLFQPFHKDEREVPNRAGYRRVEGITTTYLFIDSAFKEACGGIDTVTVAQALLARGQLVPGEKGRLRGNARPHGSEGTQRFYIVRGSILEDTE